MEEFPKAIGKVAARELSVNGIASMVDLTKYTEKELLSIHGVGPKAVRILKETLAQKNLKLRS